MTEDHKRSLLTTWYNMDRDMQNQLIVSYLRQYGSPRDPESWFDFLNDFSSSHEADTGQTRTIDPRSIN